MTTPSGRRRATLFVGCDLLAAAPGANPIAVTRSGEGVKTVDVLAHCAVPEAVALMN